MTVALFCLLIEVADITFPNLSAGSDCPASLARYTEIHGAFVQPTHRGCD
jgi:hypothetical protein